MDIGQQQDIILHHLRDSNYTLKTCTINYIEDSVVVGYTDNQDEHIILFVKTKFLYFETFLF